MCDLTCRYCKMTDAGTLKEELRSPLRMAVWSPRALWGALLLALISIDSTHASEGDRGKTFRSCLYHCTNTGCAAFLKHPHKCRHARACEQFWFHPVPQELKVTRWGCTDDCK